MKLRGFADFSRSAVLLRIQRSIQFDTMQYGGVAAAMVPARPIVPWRPSQRWTSHPLAHWFMMQSATLYARAGGRAEARAVEKMRERTGGPASEPLVEQKHGDLVSV